jgi:oligopeptidase B
VSHPPQALRHPGIRQLGQHQVPDDLAWMRQPEYRDELVTWLQAERDWYDVNAQRLAPWRTRLSARARELMPQRSETPPWTVGSSSYRWLWSEGAEHPTLRRIAQGIEETALDVNTLSTTGFVRIGDLAISPDDRDLAYTIDLVGDEAYSLVLGPVAASSTRRVLATRVYYGLVWAVDGRNLLYVAHDHADRPHQVWTLDVNTSQTVLVYEEADERFHLTLRASGDGQHAIIRSASRTTAVEFVLDLSKPEASPEETLGRHVGRDYTIELCDSNGSALLAVATATEHGSVVDLRLRSAPDTVVIELLAAAPTHRVRDLTIDRGTLIASGRNHGHACLWLLDPQGRKEPRTVSSSSGSTIRLANEHVPDEGLIEGDDHDVALLGVALSSLTHPTTWRAINIETGRLVQQLDARHEEVVSRADVVVEEHHIDARDGTQIPVTVLRRSDVLLDGRAPCLLYGYGAWETVIEPKFDPALLALVEAGVVYAHAHVRGGGEFGSAWARAGRLESKQRTFDDFADAAEALGASLVDPARIVAHGLSAGGLLMGASYSQRPDLWVGVLAEAPFVDPVTTTSDEAAPLAIIERDEWGDPRREADLAWMLSWSPFDNPPPAEQRPRLLVTTAINDPRVSAWESARWVARLREDSAADSVLLFADLDARGHWSPPGRWTSTEFRCHLLAWVADTMGLDASV